MLVHIETVTTKPEGHRIAPLHYSVFQMDDGTKISVHGKPGTHGDVLEKFGSMADMVLPLVAPFVPVFNPSSAQSNTTLAA